MGRSPNAGLFPSRDALYRRPIYDNELCGYLDDENVLNNNLIFINCFQLDVEYAYSGASWWFFGAIEKPNTNTYGLTSDSRRHPTRSLLVMRFAADAKRTY